MLFVDKHVASVKGVHGARPDRGGPSQRALIQAERPMFHSYSPARLTGGAAHRQRHPALGRASLPLTGTEFHSVPLRSRSLLAGAFIVVMIGTVVYGVRVLRAWWAMP
jgi:hypothetical protein